MYRRDVLKAGFIAGLGGFAGCAEILNDEYADASIGDVAENLYDPFIVTNTGQQLLAPTDMGWGGWKGSDDIAEALKVFLRFHPDILDFATLFGFSDGGIQDHPIHRRAPEITAKLGIPTTEGWNPSLTMDESEADARYSSFMEANSWTFPDGDSLNHPHDLLAKTIDGETHKVTFAPGGVGIPSPFAQGTLDLIQTVVVHRYRQGFSGFELDGIDMMNLRGLDFSLWARAAFRDHLESLSDDRKRELEISDVSTFDIREYLSSRNLGPSSRGDPREDPVFREYVLHHHRGMKAMFEAVKNEIQEEFPEKVRAREISFWGNQYMGAIGNGQQANIYASDYLDLIYIELMPTPTQPSDVKYKLANAIGRFEKPVTAKAHITEVPGLRASEEFDPTRSYPMLQRFQVAEAYANGAILKLPLTSRVPADSTVNNWIQSDWTVNDKLLSFIDFLWAHKRFLKNTVPDSPVAVVWSLPNNIWRRLPQWDLNQWGGPGVNTFLGTAAILRESQIPYDVLVFGQPQLWDDADQLALLERYEAVILPDIRCLTDDQLAALKQFRDMGGTVISSGAPPRRTETFAVRNDVEPLFLHKNGVILSENPGLQMYKRGESDGSLVRTLEQKQIIQLLETAEPSIGATRVSHREEPLKILHLVNYQYSPEEDEFTQIDGIDCRLSDSEQQINAGRFYSPQRITDLDIAHADDMAEFTVPSLVEWGFIVLAPSADDLQPSVSESSARDAVAHAREHIEGVNGGSRRSAPFYVFAETKLRSAESALEFDSFEQAKSASESAIEAIDVIS